MRLSGKHLVSRFAISTLRAFVAVGLALSYIVAGQATHRTEAAATQHAEFVSRSVLAPELSDQNLAAPLRAQDRRYGELLALVRSRVLRVLFPVVRVKVWREDGTVLFSDESRLLGRRFPVDDELHAAFSGEVESGISDLSAAENVFDRNLAPKLFETYVPLLEDRKSRSTRPIAVVEVYTDLGAAAVSLDRSFRLVGVALLGGLLFIYVAQLPIVRRLGRTLGTQNTLLKDLLRQEQVRVQELQELNRLKGEFVAVASHELRTPLTTILGYTKTLRRLEFAGNDAAREEFLEAIERQGDRLGRLLDNLLVASRSDDGPWVMERIAVSFPASVEEALARLGAGADRVHRDIRRDLPPIVSDPLLLDLILVNLLDNALKFSPDGKPCEVGARLEGSALVFWVQNRGVGIEPAELSHVFDRFYQVDSSSTRRHGGVGLGLHLVRRAVDDLGGEIGVDSRPGDGSRFTVTLPLQEVAVRSPSDPSSLEKSDPDPSFAPP